MSIATVRHITRDHVRITPAAGYSVVVFKTIGRDLDAIVAADDGGETIRLRIEAPGSNKLMSIEMSNECVDIHYQDNPDQPEGPTS